MSKETIKKIIIISIIFIVIISIILVIVLLNIKDNSGNATGKVLPEGEQIEDVDLKIENQIDKYDFLIVSDCISTYLDKINKNNSNYYGYDENNNYTITWTEEQIKQTAYDVLSSNYVQNNSITLDNIYDYVENINEHLMYVPVEMKEIPGDRVNTYITYGYTINSNYEFANDEYLIVNIDGQNQTFSIEPIDKEKYESSNIENEINQIEKNINNKIISTLQLSEEFRLRQYFQYYKFMLLSNVDLAYEFLNEEYREKSFGSIENFRNYVQNNRNRILQSRLTDYELNVVDEYTEFIEKDANNKYYIFNISNNDATDYNVMLDTYVIGSEELQEQYNNSSNEEKVNINTMRFINAINDKNYYYVYNVLADTFKNNNFPTYEEFQNYAESNFFDNNNIEDATFSEKTGNYIYNLTISDGNGNTKVLNVIMQLKEDTDFVMSFSIE